MLRSRFPTRPTAVALVLFAALVPAAVASEWTRWLGPEHNGAAAGKGVFARGAPSLEVSWNRPLGNAYSAVAVSDGKAVTMFADGKSDFLTALDAKTGEELWRYRIDDMFPKVGGADPGPNGMPVIDGGVVYGLGARGQIFAVKLADGSEVWSVHAVDDLGGKQPYFGFTSTPLVAAKALFVQVGGAGGNSMVALDRKSGKKLWAIGDDAVGYQSPVLIELAGKEQIVASTNKSVYGLSPKAGKVLWRAEHALVERDGFSSPVKIGDDTFVLVERQESAAFRVRGSEDGFSVEEVWRGTNLKQNFAMPVVHEGHLYGYDGDFLACVDADNGERKWKSRSSAAGLILVDGRLVIFSAAGEIVVADASPAGYNEIASVKVVEEGGYTYPTFADGGIFVRNMANIARVNVGGAKP